MQTVPNSNYIVMVQTDEQSRIIAVNSSAFASDDWGVKIDEGEGDKFHHAQNHYFPQPIYTEDGIPRYKLLDGKPVERTEEEIQADRDAVVIPPTPMEQMRADLDFVMVMGGLL